MRHLKTSSLSCAIVLAGLIASGCEGMPVREVGQSLEGSYDVETRYDMSTFSGDFAGLAGRWSKPDIAIHETILGQVEANYGAQVAAGFEAAYGDQLLRDITGYLTEESPPWLMNLESSLGSIDKQLGTVDMQAAWLFAEQQDGTMQATQIWDGIAVFENPDCPEGDALFCNQIELSAADMLDAEYPVEVLSSDYAVVDQGDTAALESGSLDFNYGRLGLYLLTNLILPDDPTAGVGLRDVVLAAINCRGLAGRIAGEDGVFGVNVGGVNVGLSLSDLIGNCEDSVFGITNRFVDRFEAPVAMQLGGIANIVDTNRDGRIDQLSAGELDGEMSFQSLVGQAEEEGPVDAVFTGFRVGDVD